MRKFKPDDGLGYIYDPMRCARPTAMCSLRLVRLPRLVVLQRPPGRAWCSSASSSSVRQQPDTPAVVPAAPPLVDRFNATLAEYPMTSFTVYTAASLGTFAAAFACLHVSGFDAPALAVGGLVGRLTKRPRMPLDLALAAALAHAIPATNALKLGPLLVPVQSRVSGAEASALEGRIAKALTWVEGPVNKYGFPYMLVHWLSGLLTVSVATACVHHGVDVVALLGRLPFSSEAAHVELVTSSASCVAGAACINSLTLPARLGLMARFGGGWFVTMHVHLAGHKRGFRSWYRRHLRANPEERRTSLRDER